MSALRKLVQDESGATAVEYGLIIALVAIAILVGVSGVGQKLLALYEQIGAAIALT